MFYEVLIAIILIVIVGLFILHRYIHAKDGFWVERNVDYVDVNKIASPWKRMGLKISFVDFDRQVYNSFNGKFGGYMEMRSAVLYIKDLDLLKKILVKDFDHFADRRSLEMNKSDPVMARMMTTLAGQEWKDLRSIMTPTFTTGRIRRMFQFFNLCGKHLVSYLNDQRSKGDDVVDFQDVFGRYTLDAIASIAFGLQTDTFKEEDSTFRKMVKKFQTVSYKKMAAFAAFLLLPKLADFLRLRIVHVGAMDFFTMVVKKNIELRRSDPTQKRPDFLQLMLEAQQGQLKMEMDDLNEYEKDAMLTNQGKKESAVVLDDLTVVAQCVLFFVAGADTLESLLTFAAYELAVNQEVQEKLAEEVDQRMEENDGNLTYDDTNQMTYLDMFISETLRLHPPAFATERVSTREYTIPDTDIVIPKGTRVMVPIASIQTDEKYYPNPDKFNPENFNSENKAQRHPYAFLPFGQGPRNCIAMRFALTEAKAAIAHLVHHFHIQPSAKTLIPAKVDMKSQAKPLGGMPLKFSPRRETS